MTSLTDGELRFLHEVLDLARDGDTPQLVTALDAGVPVNLSSPAGDSLLMLASYHCRDTTVEALLRRGADHARINDRGQTALGAATFRQSPAIVHMLLKAGADPDLGDPSARQLATFFDLTHVHTLLRLAASSPPPAPR